MKKMVYFFGRGKAEGRVHMKELLGGKGANLAEMTNIMTESFYLAIPYSPSVVKKAHFFNRLLGKKELEIRGIRS